MPKHSDTYPTVPAELKALHQWVLLKEELRNGKPTKIPYQIDGNRAKANDPNTWTDYQTVCNHRDSLSDIGFVFSKDDPYCGIYINNSIDPPQQAGISRWVRPLYFKLSEVAYQEASSSRNAIKFWTRAKLPDWMNRGKKMPLELPRVIEVYSLEEPPRFTEVYYGRSEIEVYHYGRYFTVTGNIPRGGGGEIKDGQDIVDAIIRLIKRSHDREIREIDVHNYFLHYRDGTGFDRQRRKGTRGHSISSTRRSRKSG